MTADGRPSTAVKNMPGFGDWGITLISIVVPVFKFSVAQIQPLPSHRSPVYRHRSSFKLLDMQLMHCPRYVQNMQNMTYVT
jgi:hypothetical protein